MQHRSLPDGVACRGNSQEVKPKMHVIHHVCITVTVKGDPTKRLTHLVVRHYSNASLNTMSIHIVRLNSGIDILKYVRVYYDHL